MGRAVSRRTASALLILTRVGRRCSNTVGSRPTDSRMHTKASIPNVASKGRRASLRLRAVSGRGSLQKAARTLVAAMHGRWEIDTATRNSLYDGTFHLSNK